MSDDLIKRSDAIEMLQEAIMAYPPVMKGCGETRDSTLEEAINLILDIPSADRPQGEWIETPNYTIKCSNCGAELTNDVMDACLTSRVPFPKACPICMAKMKGADDDFCSYGERKSDE